MTTTSGKPGFDPGITLLVGLAVGMMTIALLSPSPAAPGEVPPASIRSMDPNLAPWWELTVLPRIGETSARRIVSFRRAAAPADPDGLSPPVFRGAADLTQVRGIGPKTVARVAPYLHFTSGG